MQTCYLASSIEPVHFSPLFSQSLSLPLLIRFVLLEEARWCEHCYLVASLDPTHLSPLLFSQSLLPFLRLLIRFVLLEEARWYV